MLKISNITNLQFKWLQELLDTYFLEIGIIKVGICMLLLQDGHVGAKYS